MGPLLYDQLASKNITELCRHELILLLVLQRPRGWSKQIAKYIADNTKNSFYLYDIYGLLRNEYQYGFVSTNDLKEMENLIKAASIKHLTGEKNPGQKSIQGAKFSTSPVPDREV